MKALRASPSRRKGGLPLALVIARYFIYLLVATALILVAVFVVFSIMVSSGIAYLASYADDNVASMVQQLESGQREPADLPSCYRWAVLDDHGDTVASDTGNGAQGQGDPTSQGASDAPPASGLAGVQRQEKATLPNGDTCVLRYDFTPDFTSRSLRDTLPDPQTLLIGVTFVLFVATMALIAMRAARVISRKMQPLVEAASHVERQDLDFSVTFTNVREVNDVLAAIERMRGALDESLRARWAADEARRRQISALAHDLKTPLAIARWNTDLLREDHLDDDQAACSEALSDSIDRMDGYLRLLVETSQAGSSQGLKDRIAVADLADEARRQARQLCEANGLALNFSCSLKGELVGERLGIMRALMNLVANAVEYAPAGSAVAVSFSHNAGSLRISVEDEGPGFTPSGLEHGKERFYRDAEDRNPKHSHYGLGLAIVDDIVAAHNGSFEITNKVSGGARCVIEVPLS